MTMHGTSAALAAKAASGDASPSLVVALAQNAREAPNRIAYRERAFGS